MERKLKIEYASSGYDTLLKTGETTPGGDLACTYGTSAWSWEISEMINENRCHSRGRRKRYIVGTVVGIAFYLIVILVNIYPLRPLRAVDWILLTAMGVPMCLCLEWFGESLFCDKLGKKLSSKEFSINRILVVLFVFLLAAGIVCGFVFGGLRTTKW